MDFRYQVIKEAMDLQNISYPDLERLSGSPVSTLKKLCTGKIEDPKLSTLLAPFRVLGLSIDRACGLAPERDMRKEPAFHDTSMLNAMQERISMQADKITDLSTKLSAEREKAKGFERMVVEKDKHIEDFRNRSIERQATIDRMAKHGTIMRYVLAGIVIVLLAGMAYFIWELVNFDKGATGALLEQYLENYVNQ